MVKKRARNEITEAAIEAFASGADTTTTSTPKALKTAQNAPSENAAELARTTISLPADLLRRIEDIALHNKRTKQEPKNVSAIVREALEQYLKI